MRRCDRIGVPSGGNGTLYINIQEELDEDTIKEKRIEYEQRLLELKSS